MINVAFQLLFLNPRSTRMSICTTLWSESEAVDKHWQCTTARVDMPASKRKVELSCDYCWLALSYRWSRLHGERPVAEEIPLAWCRHSRVGVEWSTWPMQEMVILIQLIQWRARKPPREIQDILHSEILLTVDIILGFSEWIQMCKNKKLLSLGESNPGLPRLSVLMTSGNHDH